MLQRFFLHTCCPSNQISVSKSTTHDLLLPTLGDLGTTGKGRDGLVSMRPSPSSGMGPTYKGLWLQLSLQQGQSPHQGVLIRPQGDKNLSSSPQSQDGPGHPTVAGWGVVLSEKTDTDKEEKKLRVSVLEAARVG